MRALAIDACVDASRIPGTYLVGFDWRVRLSVSDPLTPLGAEILRAVQQHMCVRAVLHLGASHAGRNKAHVLDVGGDKAYALNVEPDTKAAYWCLPDEIITTTLREVACR